MFEIYCFFAFTLVLLFFLGWIRKNKSQNTSNLIKTENISIVVPFRDEEKNLFSFLKSISELELKPKEIIFIDDHSSDFSLEIIEKFDLGMEKSIIQLPKTQEGKKNALRKGIELAQSKFILTWDADISVQSYFFLELEKIYETDLLLLPVRMKATHFFSALAELDFYYVNNLNVACFGYTRPILANGANMLFDKKSFLENDSFQKHKNISNGDDVFILNDFKKNKKSIHLSLAQKLIVETKSPENFKEFLNQRIRWIKKTKRVGDSFANSIGLLGVLYHFGFLSILFLTKQYLALVSFKTLIDCVIFIPYLIKIKRFPLIFLIPIFSITYPIYMIFILICSLILKTYWKARKI